MCALTRRQVHRRGDQLSNLVLMWSQGTLEISAMNSKEKEKVPFDKSMFPTGNVETWLGE